MQPIDAITKHPRSTGARYAFSVLIPTWNNLPYLRLCVRSILHNSSLPIQIIVVANEAVDGTLEWLEAQADIDYIHARQNIGICYALNIGRSLAKSDYLVYANDDMYLLPNWDTSFQREIEAIGHKGFMLSATMIEPSDTGNPCVLVRNYGRSPDTFEEARLLKEQPQLRFADWCGSTWPPNVVHIDLWDMVGGLSAEYSPGMYSDPDFSKKLYDAGVRHFKGTGSSMAYHFGSTSTKRLRKKSKGRKLFLLKWGMTARTFTQTILRRGQPFAELPAIERPSAKARLLAKLKKIL